MTTLVRQPDPARPRALVIGASMAGLLTTAALSDAGYQVDLLDRDPLPARAAVRKGVPQGTQAHVLLHRGLLDAESLLPGLRRDLLAAGAVAFNSGKMPWLSELGWLDNRIGSFEIVSATRPLLEHLARERVRAHRHVQLVDGVTVTGLERAAEMWTLSARDGRRWQADVVVDASGRGSRLAQWLAAIGIGVGSPQTVDAHLGYACRRYRSVTPFPLRTGVVIGGTLDTPTAGLAMPVEDQGWLVMGAGYGDHRPPRDSDGFTAFLAGLRDPALADLVRHLEPVGEVSVHRQTLNRRYRFEDLDDWPPGLLAVGDSACAFNPIYGQGITVAAGQAKALARALRSGQPVDRRMQRRVSAVADLPWEIATSEDLRQPSSAASQSPLQRILTAWGQRVGELVAQGDAASTVVFSQVYHLMAPPVLLLHPVLIAGVARSLLRRPGQPIPRPSELGAFSPLAA